MTDNPYLKNPHIEGDDFFWHGNQTGILLIHGFTATTAEVRPLAKKLHEAGYTTAGPLLPGHGTHPDDLNRANWGMWLEKVKQSYEVLITHCHRVFVAGESMGGLLALELARQHPEIAGLFLFAPAIKINNLWASRLLWPFVKYLQKGRDVGEDEEETLPWKGYNVDPVKAAAEVHKLQKHTQRSLAEIRTPVVIFTGGHDYTIAPDSAQIILEKIGTDIKYHLHMEHSGHCVILDRELDEIADRVLKYIKTDFTQAKSKIA